jgi:hypothetical protein
MIAHCFRQVKERACRVEKNRFDHFNVNVQRTTCLRNAATSGCVMATSSAFVRAYRH